MGSFKIHSNYNPTGDNSHMVFWCIVAAGSLFLLILTLCKRRKDETE